MIFEHHGGPDRNQSYSHVFTYQPSRGSWDRDLNPGVCRSEGLYLLRRGIWPRSCCYCPEYGPNRCWMIGFVGARWLESAIEEWHRVEGTAEGLL
jgi:hypothetical protein